VDDAGVWRVLAHSRGSDRERIGYGRHLQCR
jgi:hypothetical protein